MVENTEPDPICIYTRAWQRSGTGLFSQSLALGVKANGDSVLFVSPNTENVEFEAEVGIDRLRVPRERPDRPGRLANAFRSLARVLCTPIQIARARLRSRTFVVTIPDIFPMTVPLFAGLRLTGARIIYVVHDPIPHAMAMPKRLAPLERGTHRALRRMATDLVVLSEPSRVTLEEFGGVAGKRIAVIEHGIFELDAVMPPPRNGQLLAFGTLRRNKGFADAITAVLRLREEGADVRLLIAGGAHDLERDHAQELQALADLHPEAVTLRLGHVPDEALPGLFAEVDALILPYRDFASQSGVAILAATNERPLIATAAGGLSVLFDEGMAGTRIAAPVDVDSVADAIRLFRATPPEQWEEKARTFALHLRATRSWPAIAAAYRRVAEGKGD